MRALYVLALVLAIDLASLAALTAEPVPLRGTLAHELPSIRKVYP